MAAITLTNTQQRNNFFRRVVLDNLQYWQQWMPDKTDDVKVLGYERDGIIRAISFALEIEDAHSSVFDLTAAFSPYIEKQGHWDVWNAILNRAVEVAQQVGDVKNEVDLLIWIARLSYQQTRFLKTVGCYRRAIRLSRQIGDKYNEARACSNLGYYYIKQAYWRRAEVLCCHALELFEQIDNNHGRAHTENHLGVLYLEQRMSDQARHHLEKACSVWQTMGDEYGLVYGFINLGTLYTRERQPGMALNYLNKALEQAKKTGAETSLATIYLTMGYAHRVNGDLAKAEKCALKASALFSRFSNQTGIAQAKGNLGIVYFHQDKLPAAISHLDAALEIWLKLKNNRKQIETLLEIVECEIKRKDTSQAIVQLNRLKEIIAQTPKNMHPPSLQQRFAALSSAVAV